MENYESKFLFDTVLFFNYGRCMFSSSNINYRVDADKGFNFALPDDAFVCQKKNHFQITVHVSIPGNARYIRQPVEENISRIDSFYLHFYGIKVRKSLVFLNILSIKYDFY